MKTIKINQDERLEIDGEFYIISVDHNNEYQLIQVDEK